MMQSADRRIYEFLDGWVAYCQTRLAYNLEAAKVWTVFAMLVFSLATARSTAMFVFNSAWFGLLLFGRVLLFKENGDYPESIKKCERLNASAVANRENESILRIIILFLLLPPIIASLWIKDTPFEAALWSAWFMTLITDLYLRCCFYLGPGEHSRELNKKIAADAVKSGV